MKRALERLMVAAVIDLIATRQIQEHDTIVADLHRDHTRLMFQRVANDPAAALARTA